MTRLEQWFMAKNGLSNGSGAPAPPAGPGAPPPPPPPGPEVKIMLRGGNAEIIFFEIKILSRPPRTDFLSTSVGTKIWFAIHNNARRWPSSFAET